MEGLETSTGATGRSRKPSMLVLVGVWVLLEYMWTTRQLTGTTTNRCPTAADLVPDYSASTLRGRPPKRPFARELAALRSLVRRPTRAAAVTRLTFERRPRVGADTLATRTSALGCSCG